MLAKAKRSQSRMLHGLAEGKRSQHQMLQGLAKAKRSQSQMLQGLAKAKRSQSTIQHATASNTIEGFESRLGWSGTGYVLGHAKGPTSSSEQRASILNPRGVGGSQGLPGRLAESPERSPQCLLAIPQPSRTTDP